jgi:hypothetical protein
MKSINVILSLLFIAGFGISCNTQPDKRTVNSEMAEAGSVEVFYFHNTRRCVTCQAVETESKDLVEELYRDKVTFLAYNLEEQDGKAMAGELGVSGQTLLIVSGETRINVTNEGFLNARSNPEKFKQILKEKIDPLL